MMLAEAMRMLYGYHRWATDRIFDTATQLTPEQFNAPGTAGRGSIRQTLVHLIQTQKGWVSWWDGSLPAEEAVRVRLDMGENPELAEIGRGWDAVTEQTETFTNRLSEEELAQLYPFPRPGNSEGTMPLWQKMLHVANHGTQHLSEVAAMLTSYGHSPGDLDFLFYALQAPQHTGQ